MCNYLKNYVEILTKKKQSIQVINNKYIITYFKSGNAHANMTNVIPIEPAKAKLIKL